MEFEVVEGITPTQLVQLLDYSKTDPVVRMFTSDPMRFKDKRSFNKWLRKGRTIYCLTDAKKNLCGIIWFGGKRLLLKEFTQTFNRKEYGITFAIRTYGKARSKKLANEFMKKAFSQFKFSDEYKRVQNKKVWLEVAIDNIPAIKVYKRFGFRRVTDPDESGRVIMILMRD